MPTRRFEFQIGKPNDERKPKPLGTLTIGIDEGLAELYRANWSRLDLFEAAKHLAREFDPQLEVVHSREIPPEGT